MSIVSSTLNSKGIVKESQKSLDNDHMLGLVTTTKKGHEAAKLFTLSEMKGNFFINSDEFYNKTSSFYFLYLNIIYKSIVQEARTIQVNDIFMNLVNNYFNDRFVPCLFNYYINAPNFFVTLFPNDKERSKNPRANRHQSFEKYFYLLCIIAYVNENKESDEFLSLPEDFRKNMVNWCITRDDPNIQFQLTGPRSNYQNVFDYESHYKNLISVQNTAESVNDYNKLVRLQNINDYAVGILEFLKNMNNVYNKTPDEARAYIFNLDTLTLQQKYKDSDGKLIFDLAYTDFGDTTSETSKARLQDIEKLKTENITLSKSNIGKLQTLFNMYSRISITSLVVDKNTYITNLSKLKTVYVVFEGITCSDKTVGINKTVGDGDLVIPGTFVVNEQGNYSFVPKSQNTTYLPNRVRVQKCNIYLTTYNSINSKSNVIPSYAISLDLARDKFYNIPLKIVGKGPALFSDITYNRFNKNFQFPDLLFNNVGNKIKFNDMYTQNQLMNKLNEAFYSIKDTIDKEYNVAINTVLPSVGGIMFTTWEYINSNIEIGKLLYFYDFDTKLINVKQISRWPDDILSLNAFMYRTFMREFLFSYFNYITDMNGTQKLLLNNLDEYANYFNNDTPNVVNTLTTDNGIMPAISNEKMFSVSNTIPDIAFIQNLQYLNDTVVYVNKINNDLRNTLNIGIITYAKQVNTNTSSDTNYSNNNLKLQYLEARFPLIDYTLRIYPDTKSIMYKDNIIYTTTDIVNIKYVFTNNNGGVFNKCSVFINNEFYDIMDTFDIQLTEEQYTNIGTYPNANITISFNVFINTSSLTSDQTKVYIQLTQATVTTDSTVSDNTSSLQVYNKPNDGVYNLLSVQYSNSNNSLVLFNDNEGNNIPTQIVTEWGLDSNLLDYSSSTFDYIMNLVYTGIYDWFNPLTSNNFISYNINDNVMNNDITLMPLVKDLPNNSSVFTYLPGGKSNVNTTIPIENCYISTDSIERQYIESGNIVFNTDFKTLTLNEISTQSITVYDSDKFDSNPVYTVYKKYAYEANTKYNINKSGNLFSAIASIFESTGSGNGMMIKDQIAASIINDIYTIADDNVLTRLVAIMSVNGENTNLLSTLVFMHYIYRYISNLYTNINNNKNSMLNSDGIYEYFYKLDFPLLINLNENENYFLNKVNTQYAIGNNNLIKLVATNFDIFVEIYATTNNTTINIMYVYNNITFNPNAIGNLTYSTNGMSYPLYAVTCLKSTQLQSYYLMEIYAITSSNMYLNNFYTLDIMYNNQWNNLFGYIDYLGMINIENVNISVALENGTITNASLYFPTELNTVIRSNARTFTVHSVAGIQTLQEYRVITAKPTNDYTYINYYGNKYYPLQNIFGNSEYYKRLIYYYQILYGDIQENTPIFNSKQTLSRHEYVQITYENNQYNTKKDDNTGYIIDLFKPEYYIMVNYDNSTNPEQNNINNNAINMLLNKSDIEMSLQWT